MESERHSSVSFQPSLYHPILDANQVSEHTLLVTEDGVEILTARLPDSPGGPVSMPIGDGEKMQNGETNTEAAA